MTSSILWYIAGFVNKGFFKSGGRIRGVPLTIGGTSSVPPLPIETVIIKNINKIISRQNKPIDIAIELCLYCMKSQFFIDGNKCTAIIFANHYLIPKAGDLLVIPENQAKRFKELLVSYYEGNDNGEIYSFLKQNYWRKFR